MSVVYTTDQGSQNISYAYNQDAVARLFNKVSSKMLPIGVYEGFGLTRLSNTTVQVAAGTAFVPDANNVLDPSGNRLGIRVRVENYAAIVLDLATVIGGSIFDSTKPYLVIRFGWANQTACYAHVVAVAYSDDPAEDDENAILPTDIVIGKVNADTSGSPVIIRSADPFDLTRKNWACLPSLQSTFDQLKVMTCETDATKITIASGSVRTAHGFLNVAGGNYPAAGISATTAGRRDLVWVDTDGVINITEGIDAASPVTPPYGTKKVIAEIRRGASRNTIRGSDIFMVDQSIAGQIAAADIELADVGGYVTATAYTGGYTRKTVENAIQQIFQQLVAGTDAATASTIVRRDANANAQFGILKMTSSMVGVGRIPTTYPLEVAGSLYLVSGDVRINTARSLFIGAHYLTAAVGIGFGINRTPTTYAFEVSGDMYATGRVRGQINVPTSAPSSPANGDIWVV